MISKLKELMNKITKTKDIGQTSFSGRGRCPKGGWGLNGYLQKSCKNMPNSLLVKLLKSRPLSNSPQLGRETGLLHFVRNDNTRKKMAFTLAEVLITLAIIGVVAAMTIPNLIQKINEQVTVKKVQKAYSVLSQSYLYSINEYGYPSSWGILYNNKESAKLIRDRLLIKARITSICNDKTTMKKCGYLKTLLRTKADVTWDNESPAAFAQISNGTAVAFISRGDNRGSGPLELVLAIIRIDINGTNKPNTKGIDQFDFYLTDSGIIPLGTKDEKTFTFNDCKTKGRACAAWILKQKNLNYLHSDKCSWQNTSCK